MGTTYWACGAGGALYKQVDGGTWTVQTSGTTTDLLCCHGASDEFVLFGGWNRKLIKYDGTSYTTITTGILDAAEDIHSIWCVSTTNIIIFTQNFGSHHRIYHWNGTDGAGNFTLLRDGPASEAASQGNNLWADVDGTNIVLACAGFYLHSDDSGSTWTKRTYPYYDLGAGIEDFNIFQHGVYGTSVDDLYFPGVWAVPSNSERLKCLNGSPGSLSLLGNLETISVKYYAADWESGNATWISPTGNVYVVGQGNYQVGNKGKIFVWDGASWDSLDAGDGDSEGSPYIADLNRFSGVSLFGVSDDDIVAVNEGKVYHWKGSTGASGFETLSGGTTDFYDVWGIATKIADPATTTTLTSDIQAHTGKSKNVFLKIDGVEPIFWCWHEKGEPTGWSRSIKTCLNPPEEHSVDLDLGEFKLDISAMDFELHYIPDSDGTDYLGKLFAPGKWEQAAHTNIKPGTTANQFVEANATEIPVQSVTGLATSGVKYISSETIHHTGVSTVAGVDYLTGVTRGYYPCVGTTGIGKAYQRPLEDDVGRMASVSEAPFSMHGRMVTLNVTSWVDDTETWRDETDSQVVWVGRIANGIQYDGYNLSWKVSCVSLANEFNQKIAANLPETQLQNVINLLYTDGFEIFCSVEEQDTVAGWSRTTINASAYVFLGLGTIGANTALGHTTTESLINHLNNNIENATWTSYDTSASPTQPTILFKEYSDGKIGFYASYQDSATTHTTAGKAYVTITADERCHVLRALGFDLPIQQTFNLSDGNDGDNGLWYGELEAKDLPFKSYQPLRYAGRALKRLYVTDINPLWDDQGDYYPNGVHVNAAHVQIDKCKDGDDEVTFFGRSTSKDASNIYLNLIDSPQKPLSEGAYAGSRIDEDATIVKNIFIPATSSGYGTTYHRGCYTTLACILCSTGSSTYNSSFDVLPSHLGLGIPQALIDFNSFEAAERATLSDPLAFRRLDPISGMSFTELVSREAKLFGYAMLFQNGKFTMTRTMPPDLYNYAATINEDVILNDEFRPALNSSIDTVVNTFECKIDYNHTLGKHNKTYMISDVDSVTNLHQSKAITIEHKGIAVDEVTGIKKLLEKKLLNRILRFPMPIVDMPIPQTLFNQIYSGDTVKYVSSKCPSLLGDGTLDTDVYAMVLKLNWSYHSALWVGNMRLLLLGQVASYGAPWAPSALINNSHATGGWDSVNKQLHLESLYYGETGDTDDGAAFTSGDYVTLIERCPTDPTSPQTWGPLLVDQDYEADGDGILTLDSGTTLTGYDSAKEYKLLFSDYDEVTTSQKTRGTWQADTTNALIDSAAARCNPNLFGY